MNNSAENSQRRLKWSQQVLYVPQRQ